MVALEPDTSMPLLENDANLTKDESDSQSEVAPPYQANPAPLSNEKDVTSTTTKTNEKDGDKVAGKKELPAIGVSKTLQEVFETTSKLTICAFGPQTSFFFYGGDENISWVHSYKQSEYPQAVSGVAISSWLIKTPYHVALSPHGAGYFAYASHQEGIVWRFIDIPASTRPKKRKLRVKFDATVVAYARLKNWLVENVSSADDMKRARVVFGPEGRYMAWKPDGSWIGNDLPVDLRSELDTRRSASGKVVLPTLVTFGCGNAWAAIWSDGSHSINLDKRFETLDKILKQNPGAKFSVSQGTSCDMVRCC
jgi:hypothetical protein